MPGCKKCGLFLAIRHIGGGACLWGPKVILTTDHVFYSTEVLGELASLMAISVAGEFQASTIACLTQTLKQTADPCEGFTGRERGVGF